MGLPFTIPETIYMVSGLPLQTLERRRFSPTTSALLRSRWIEYAERRAMLINRILKTSNSNDETINNNRKK